jgi:exoribonuclease R
VVSYYLHSVQEELIDVLCCSDIVEEIGVCGELGAETRALLLENEIEFLPCDVELHQYFPRSPFKIPEDEIKSRADLRWAYICVY